MTMIERVARALEPKCRAFGQGDMPMAIAREFARAAIEAMREPTKGMIEPGYRTMDDMVDFYNYDSGAGYSIDPIGPAEVWRAMIDQALKDEA